MKAPGHRRPARSLPATKKFAPSIPASNNSTNAPLAREAREKATPAVRENHSLYLGPIEQRAIALRQFEGLLESASEAVTFAASLVQEDAPERLWNPSESIHPDLSQDASVNR